MLQKPREVETKMEDEAEIYDGVRAQFPLSFGKQSKPQTSLEAIHSTTRRSSSTTATATATTNKTDELPSLSSSSKDWLSSLRNPNSNSNSNSSTNEDEADLIGPPRPPTDDEDEDVGPIVGPPRPSAAQLESIDEEEEEEEMVGPPRPPPGMSFGDSGDEVEEEEETENQYRIPLSNEIVLKGHTKVLFSLSQKLR